MAVLVTSARDVNPLPSKRLKAFVSSQAQPPQRAGQDGHSTSNAIMSSFRQSALPLINSFRYINAVYFTNALGGSTPASSSGVTAFAAASPGYHHF